MRRPRQHLDGRRPRPVGVAVLGLALAGCAVGAEDCDPGRVQGLLTAAACEAGGRYAERGARLRAAADARVAEHRLAEAEARGLEAEAARLAADREAWAARLAAMDRDLAVLEADLGRARAGGRRGQAELDALAAQARALKRDVARAKTRGEAGAAAGANPDGPALEAEIRALTLEVERRRQAIREILEGVAAY